MSLLLAKFESIMQLINNPELVNPLFVYAMLCIFSLMVGSFLNVLIYRLPLMLQTAWKMECREALQLPTVPHVHLNLFFPRSFCPGCNTLISAWKNIPVVSYLLLRGRCNQCQQRISIRYPFVEIVCMMLSVYAGIRFGFNATLLFSLLFIWLMISLCAIDIQHQLLPDSLTLSLLWLGLIANTQSLFTSLSVAVFSAVSAYLGLWLLMKVYYLCTGKIGMGNGDFKLFAALGAWFGWTQLPLILILSSVSGVIVGLTYLAITKKTRDTPIPFGPFLCFAGLVSLFYGKQLMEWYWLSALKLMPMSH